MVDFQEGKTKVIGATLAAGLELQAARAEAAKHDELSPKGRAQFIEKHVRTKAGPALTRSRRQLDYHARKIENMRAAIQAKAIGEPKPADAEYRTYLRSLTIGERIQVVLTDAAARGAALREPGLSGLNADMLGRALAAATDPSAVAALDAATEQQEIHAVAVRTLANEIGETPFIVDPASGAVRTFRTLIELDNWMAKEMPPSRNAAVEEIEADANEEAA